MCFFPLLGHIHKQNNPTEYRLPTVYLKRTRLHVAQNISVLLIYIVTSGGSAVTFVLESRCPAAAIILPGLTFGIKALKLSIVGFGCRVGYLDLLRDA